VPSAAIAGELEETDVLVEYDHFNVFVAGPVNVELWVHHSIARKGQADTIMDWQVGLFNGRGVLTFDLTLNFCDGEERTLPSAIMRDIRVTHGQCLNVGGAHKIPTVVLQFVNPWRELKRARVLVFWCACKRKAGG
jgi:hypothetical protein